MSEFVDSPEIINVDHDDGEVQTIAAGKLELFSQLFHEITPQVEAGQIINDHFPMQKYVDDMRFDEGQEVFHVLLLGFGHAIDMNLQGDRLIATLKQGEDEHAVIFASRLVGNQFVMISQSRSSDENLFAYNAEACT